MKIKQVSVVGLGKLGICLAAVLAHRGFRVNGVDVDQSKIESINRGHSPIYEPRLSALIRASDGRLMATSQYRNAIAQSDATFVVVPTPSDQTGGFSLKFVKQAMREIGRTLSEKSRYHLVILTSTVMPGSMEGQILPLLEKNSGKLCGKDFGLCYNPEFIALGNVIYGLLNPDFILIGESDSRAGEALARIHSEVCTNSPPVEHMNFINAEITKISVNSFVTMKMSFANTIAEISERLAGADVNKITSAIGKDKRIGSAYLKGALGYGGPCFPRDNIAFSRFATRIGAQAELARATHRVNLRQIDRIVDLIEQQAMRKGAKIGILGLSYKPDTNVVDESQSLMVAKRLAERGFEVSVHDPASMANARAILGASVKYETTAEDCVDKSDICVVGTPWKQFSRLSPALFEKKTVIDCWGLFDHRLGRDVKYVPIGRSVMAAHYVRTPAFRRRTGRRQAILSSTGRES